MEIKLLESDKKNGTAVFVLTKTTPSFGNLIRKYVLEKVPTMAVEDIEFRKNGSVLYDEIIAHRIGLIPLTTDLKTYNLPQECKCKGEGCARCSVKMTLSTKGPGTIYASDIKSKDSKIKPAYPKMPIVKLLKGQDLELGAVAFLGQGKDHVKWSPGHIYYKYTPIIDIKGEVKNPEKIKQACPVDVFDVKGDKLVINKNNLIKCHLCGACQDLNQKIVIGEDNTELIFYVESFGQLSCREMVAKAMELFEADLNEFGAQLKKAAK